MRLRAGEKIDWEALPPGTVPWVAGLLEGEGFFGVVTNWVNKKAYRYPRIGVSMTDRDIIDRIALLWGIKIYVLPPDRRAKKVQYRVTLHGNRAIEWMKALYPWMGERRRAQIDVALAEWDARPDPNELRRQFSKAQAGGKKRTVKGTFIRETEGRTVDGVALLHAMHLEVRPEVRAIMERIARDHEPGLRYLADK